MIVHGEMTCTRGSMETFHPTLALFCSSVHSAKQTKNRADECLTVVHDIRMFRDTIPGVFCKEYITPSLVTPVLL